MAIDHVELGQFNLAKSTIEQNYSQTGKERLLFELELATINHIEGNYVKSNFHLTRAKHHLESFYTTSISEQALAMLSGPTFATYEGHEYYRPLVHLTKAFNFNQLAQLNPDSRQEYLDSSLVEMRQLNVFLNQLKRKTGGYDNEPNSSSLTEQIHAILKPLFAPQDLLKNIDYKADAFAHYVSALLHEQNEDLDSARLEYERSLNAYKKGFSEQYDLGSTPEKLSATNLARVMTKAGGYQNQVRRLNKAYSLPKKQEANKVTLIQNIGIAPTKKQLNLILSADHRAKALVMTPVLTGNAQERREQMHWFQMLYADTSLFDMLQNYATGDIQDVALGFVTKRIPLGPLWKEAQRIGLIDALEYGGRISVSYIAPPVLPVKRSEVWQNGKKIAEFKPFYSVSMLSLQSALRRANSDIRVALTREIVKAITAQKAIRATGADQNNLLGSFAKIAATAVNAITAGADTRQWQSLPAQIRLAELSVEPGLQNLTIKTTLNSGRTITQSATINAQGSMTMWHTRTFLNTNINSSATQKL